MTLRYIFHSGFILETERCILSFDYWMDPAHVMKQYIDLCESRDYGGERRIVATIIGE